MAEFATTPVYEDNRDLSTESSAKAAAIAGLVALVKTRWRLSVQHKMQTGVTKDIEECRRAMAGLPISGAHIDPDLPVILNVTASICEGMHALLQDAMAVSAENLFTIKATPVPDLTEEAQAQITRELQDQVEALGSLGVQMSLADMAEAARGMAEAVKQHEQQQAAVAAEALRVQVQDLLVEGDFRKAFDAALLDYVSSMATIVKAPAVKSRAVRVWENGRMQFRSKLVRAVERIDPACFFLAPGGLTPQSAEWTFELRRVQPHDLMALSTDANYDAQEILRVFRMYPEGYVEVENSQPSIFIQDAAAYTRSFAYDALEMHGLIKGSVLKAMGVTVGSVDRAYESVIVAIGDCVIASMVNTDASGERPYRMQSFYKSPTSAWGGSPASRLRDLQRVISSLFIALGGDAALAGVHIEVDPAMLHADDKMDKRSVRPRTVRLVKSNLGSQRERAYNIFSVQAQITTFQQEIQNLFAMAYEIVGIPRMALGQTTGAGTLGRTAGGVASMLNQATKGTRRALLDLETDIIEPTVQGFLDWIMMFNPPRGFRGDVNAQARGLSGLVEQAAAADGLTEALALIGTLEGKTGPTGEPVVPVGATARIVYKILKAKGIPTAGLFSQDYDTQDALAGSTAAPMPVRGAVGFGPSGPTSLDSSRSPAAAGAIAASNAPMGPAA